MLRLLRWDRAFRVAPPFLSRPQGILGIGRLHERSHRIAEGVALRFGRVRRVGVHGLVVPDEARVARRQPAHVLLTYAGPEMQQDGSHVSGFSLQGGLDDGAQLPTPIGYSGEDGGHHHAARDPGIVQFRNRLHALSRVRGAGFAVAPCGLV